MNWTVYILRCADDSLYTGITTNLERRIDEHNNDDLKGAKYTRARRPVSLAYQEACKDRSNATKRELQLKRLSRAKKISLLNSHLENP